LKEITFSYIPNIVICIISNSPSSELFSHSGISFRLRSQYASSAITPQKTVSKKEALSPTDIVWAIFSFFFYFFPISFSVFSPFNPIYNLSI